MVPARRLTVHNFLTVNGFFKGPHEDTSWHRHGPEETAYSEEALARGNVLLFGRRTYQMMEAFWPTPDARAAFPKVAAAMERAEKLVFTKGVLEPTWANARVVQGDPVAAVRDLKASPGKDLTVLGSGIVAGLLAAAGLVDELELLVDPVALPSGTPLLPGLRRPLRLHLVESRAFRSGTVLLRYRPDGDAGDARVEASGARAPAAPDER